MSAPRWLTAIQNALSQHEKQSGAFMFTHIIYAESHRQQVFQLATVDTDALIPQARSHIVRSFLVPPTAPSLPLIVSTTDVRSPKVSQINANPHVHIVHWIEGTQEQYRFTGRAVIVPSPRHALYQHFVDFVAKQRKNGSSGITALIDSGFNWERQRVDTFESLSGHMKATWCRPAPGSPLIGGEEEAKKWPVKLEEPGVDSDEESKRNWETALMNFSLVVIEPYECDYIEPGIPERRTKFSRTKDGNWREEALVP